jgi:D-alanine-D-alanine ligase
MLVPAIAESFGLDFVGLDAMGQALAHDKEVMKRIAQDCGLATPPWRVLRDATFAKQMCEEFPTPFVIKPIAEGSSIGISQRNLIYQPREGDVLARELLERFRQPVLIESFAGGREVSFISVEAAPRPHQALVEVVVDGQPDFFSTRLFDADEKLNRRLPRSIQRIDNALNSDDKAAIERLLDTIGHYGVVRVDGKLGDDGRFVFLELTTDPWLGVRGHVAQAFIGKGWTYSEVIRAILASALLAPRGQLANG